MEYLFTFVNTFAAIQAQDRLDVQKIPFNVMPLPSSLGDSCGICLRVKNNDLADVQNEFKQSKIALTGFYQIQVINGKKRYQLCH
ncbi:DUF3343 domain-containing protein [Loigolactobacillus jiayinensis]|uniref:DUF3343 domain-containing protein n=1 Tax=Loigolactobacillus jiayinensis TaxID=2486016 RepID=A0ABW1RFZ6_9LACO|nr:DUF3343 domain-containing protein [Loigolactobacillus jiayinensis]